MIDASSAIDFFCRAISATRLEAREDAVAGGGVLRS